MPASLAGPNSPGGVETKKAIAAQANGTKFIHRVYKSADVVSALREMFVKKCAYCEFNYSAGGPEDIEHFRPKGAVIINGKLIKPGYYWLGADWGNLLPSCIDCNRLRTKLFTNTKQAMSGKASMFPVADEKQRWRSHRTKNREECLLLNPCEDRPGKHLEFLDGGLVAPALDKMGKASEKGRISIEVFGLLRTDLVEERERKQTRVRAAIELALDAAESAELESNPVKRAKLDRLVAKLLLQAREHLSPKEPFLAATRAIFAEYDL